MHRKKGEGRLWPEAGAGYLPCGNNMVKKWDSEWVLVGGLLWLNGNYWWCLCGNLLEMDPLGKGARYVGS